ncbi:cyclase/dehydrase [Histoplasma capsulatum var. duboisii H88]|uniref:Cyclase/dehydrase n=2 Tax=Ajellomyces capsulatus TaxID=5037 RepID=F0UDH2_AJEC8|nr:cyclase/dehydrase [Histoplasma capsulatum H143]EGC42713.1 cyclase/dehydrase [Histoplasma capsulatum var. duboisii H88]
MRPPNLLLLRRLRCPHTHPPLSTGITTLISSRRFHLPSLPSLPSFTNPISPKPPPPRTLTATRNLAFPPSLLFRTIADIDSYADFLPFLTESTVTVRDARTGYPTNAFLTVGYGPLKETFVSRVTCDAGMWTVGARSGRRGDGGETESGEAGDGGLFEFLDTLWKLRAVGDAVVNGNGNGNGNGGGSGNTYGRGAGMTTVELEVRFQFRSALHAAVMGAVEDQVAGMMIEAFEKRVRDLEKVKVKAG